MDYSTLLQYRQSTRNYTDEKLTKEQIDFLLEAANRAPVGSKMYQDVHITIVSNQEKLIKMCEAAWYRFTSKQKLEEIAGDTLSKERADQKKTNLFYGAPTVFFVSHRKQTLQPGIEWANVTSVVNQIHLAATELGLGSVYMWGALESMRMFPEYDHTDLLELPENFEPLLAIAVGNPKKPLEPREISHAPITYNEI